MFWRYNYQGIAWAIFILLLCGLPGDQFSNSRHENVDSIVHLILYSILFFLLSVGFIKQSDFSWLRRNTLRKVLIACVVYGVVIEMLQASIFVGRSIELSDMLFNGIGALIGMGVFASIYGSKAYL